MKLISSILLSSFFTILFACNNNQNKSAEELAKEQQDSIHRADSIKQENAIRDDRELYRKSLQSQIDSMRRKVEQSDSIYAKRTEKERSRWIEHRTKITSRIDRLQKKKGDIGTVAKDDWDKFKLEVDTATTNLKNDWNTMLEKMKAK